jgi:hypothetical protein
MLDEEESLVEERFSLTTVNQTWFKFLALISFLCAVFVNAALIWLLVCRTQRLQPTDEQLKKTAALNKHFFDQKHASNRRKRIDLKKKLKYLFLGTLNVRSPPRSAFVSTSNSSSFDRLLAHNNNNDIKESQQLKRKSNNQTNCVVTNELDKKSKYKRVIDKNKTNKK